jgi:hypothetical protein
MNKFNIFWVPVETVWIGTSTVYDWPTNGVVGPARAMKQFRFELTTLTIAPPIRTAISQLISMLPRYSMKKTYPNLGHLVSDVTKVIANDSMPSQPCKHKVANIPRNFLRSNSPKIHLMYDADIGFFITQSDTTGAISAKTDLCIINRILVWTSSSESTRDISRQHHLHTFSQKLCGRW